MTNIMIKRIYDPYDELDGERILVDRLWPRGIRKEEAKLSEWAKEVAPSSELKKWFAHKSERFAEFKTNYVLELQTDKEKIEKVMELCLLAKEKKITLLYAAKDPIHNHAQVLREELLRKY